MCLAGRQHEVKRDLCTQEPLDLKKFFMRHLTARIKASGPLSVAEYMKEVLINPVTVREQKQTHNENSLYAL